MYCKTVFYGRIRVHTFRKSADRAISDGVCTRNRLFSEVQLYIRGMCSARSNCTYEVCASPSYCQVSKQRAIDIGPLLPHFTIVLREVGSGSTDFLGGRLLFLWLSQNCPDAVFILSGNRDGLTADRNKIRRDAFGAGHTSESRDSILCIKEFRNRKNELQIIMPCYH